ncbi:MAG: helix-hairpin-helix domain-containing protein, partial [Anaerolineales bacterium]
QAAQGGDAMSELPLQVDINRAAVEALVELPGIGDELANRIISRRPFHHLEELLGVPGIGQKGIERLRPYLQFSQDSGSEAPEKIPAGPAAHKGGGSTMGRREPGRPGANGRDVWRPSLMWTLIGTGLASIVLSVILSLAILAAINGTLSIERNEQVRLLGQQAAAVQGRVDELSSSIDSIETRLQAVEGLSGRMTTLENEFAGVRNEMDSARAELEGVKSSLTTLTEQMGSLESRVSVFDAFLRGLQRILQEVLPEQPMEVLP